MRTYFSLFLIAAFASLVLTPLLRRVCDRFGLVSEPLDDRHIHRQAVPRLGGVAIFLSVLIALSALLLLENLLTRTLSADIRQIGVFLTCGLLVLMLGVYDDLRGANATVKLVGLIAITVVFYALGGRIEGLSIPFIGQVSLHPILGCLLTVVWVVGIANAFNLIDGVDGLATGSALFSSLVLLTISMIQGRTLVAVVALALTGALAGFLRYNFNPASIFLGDSGSLFVGFALAALSVQGMQKASTAVAVAIPILAFGLPVVDTSVTIARRFLSGKPIFKGDREHIHHKLLARGWSQRRVVFVLYGVSAAFGLMAMLFVNTGNGLTAVILFVLGVAVALALGNLRYHEVAELRASVKRNIGDRRVRAINNLRMRRACEALSSAASLDQLFDAVVEVLESGEFVYADAELTCNGHAEVNLRAFELAEANSFAQHAKIVDGRVQWSWQRGNGSTARVLDSNQFWVMRLPLTGQEYSFGFLDIYRPLNAEPLLVDINYLTNDFQPAVAEAAERIFTNAEQSMPRQWAAGIS
jgi:UDP-GlcNAc:undecaprenyl-phosphate/decaprenyl-phosphate GlcNAc-1-phosphate transferase